MLNKFSLLSQYYCCGKVAEKLQNCFSLFFRQGHIAERETSAQLARLLYTCKHLKFTYTLLFLPAK